MNETVLIKSKQTPIVKIISLIILIVGFVIGWVLSINYWPERLYTDYFWTSIVPYCMSIWFLPFAAFAALIYFAAARSKLTVTDKRVYGTALFGKRVDLPVDSISAVATSNLKGLSVATSAGRISFLGIKNRDDIHQVISKLLMERQDKSSRINHHDNVQRNADELKKYKELLDSGVITQEEFNAKKKQLLGL